MYSALKPLQDKENRLLRTQEREREPDERQKQPSKDRKDAKRSTHCQHINLYKYHIVHIYITNIKYVRNHHAGYI